jgi:hypothetical protein
MLIYLNFWRTPDTLATVEAGAKTFKATDVAGWLKTFKPK